MLNDHVNVFSKIPFCKNPFRIFHWDRPALSCLHFDLCLGQSIIYKIAMEHPLFMDAFPISKIGISRTKFCLPKDNLQNNKGNILHTPKNNKTFLGQDVSPNPWLGDGH